MSLHISQPWEYRLVAWAQEAFESHIPHPGIQADSDLLHAAYHHCATITRTHSRTFFLASGLLPPEKRRAARALYAFCRVTDDIIDNTVNAQERQTALLRWRDHVMNANPPMHDLVAVAWADTKAHYNIPSGYAEQLIDGVARDLDQQRYDTFEQLAEYAYGVASTVGLMAMHIIGFSGEEALPYAVRLGVALQTTNILRDIAEDYRIGRIYLPQEELDAFGLDEDFIARGQVDARWRAFMRFQIERNHRLYEESWPGIALLEKDGRFAIAAAAELYRGILADIEAYDYNVFDRRAHLSTTAKLSRIPKIWWRNRRNRIA
ncbi:MAG: phytoene/squalene synthase family protein [Anaerolineae bacterium]